MRAASLGPRRARATPIDDPDSSALKRRCPNQVETPLIPAKAGIQKKNLGPRSRRDERSGTDSTQPGRGLAGALSLHRPEVGPLVHHPTIGKPAHAVLAPRTLADLALARFGRRTPTPD